MCKAINDIICAAKEMQYYLEVQPMGKVRQFGGKDDVRILPSFIAAKAVLDRFDVPVNDFDCAVCPGCVLLCAMAVAGDDTVSSEVVLQYLINLNEQVRTFLSNNELKFLQEISDRLKRDFTFCSVALGT